MTDKDRSRLSQKQLQAIELIMTGMTDKEVAEKVGVARQTVNEWRNHNPAFIAEMNRRRKAMYEASLNRLLRLTSKSLDAIEKELENGNWKLAVEIMRMVFNYRDGIFGPTDEEEIEVQQSIVKKNLDLDKLTAF